MLPHAIIPHHWTVMSPCPQAHSWLANPMRKPGRREEDPVCHNRHKFQAGASVPFRTFSYMCMGSIPRIRQPPICTAKSWSYNWDHTLVFPLMKSYKKVPSITNWPRMLKLGRHAMQGHTWGNFQPLWDLCFDQLSRGPVHGFLFPDSRFQIFVEKKMLGKSWITLQSHYTKWQWE